MTILWSLHFVTHKSNFPKLSSLFSLLIRHLSLHPLNPFERPPPQDAMGPPEGVLLPFPPRCSVLFPFFSPFLSCHVIGFFFSVFKFLLGGPCCFPPSHCPFFPGVYPTLGPYLLSFFPVDRLTPIFVKVDFFSTHKRFALLSYCVVPHPPPPLPPSKVWAYCWPKLQFFFSRASFRLLHNTLNTPWYVFPPPWIQSQSVRYLLFVPSRPSPWRIFFAPVFRSVAGIPPFILYSAAMLSVVYLLFGG